MRWEGRRESANVEDRRGMPVGGLALGGGLGTMLLVLVVAFMGGDPGILLNQQPGGQPAQDGGAGDDELSRFARVVLADTEDVWHDLFPRQLGKPYRDPTLVLYSRGVQSGCGTASSSVGPFYCPADEKVYIDLTFFNELGQQFGASGDFAMAYVIAHEVGHHVQNQLGISDRVHEARGRLNDVQYNQMSVRLELQADFLAGVWAHHAEKAKQILERGDVEEALNAANAIGDDRLQKRGRGEVDPDSFTHGTSAQRVRWFRRGLETGDLTIMDELFERPYDQL